MNTLSLSLSLLSLSSLSFLCYRVNLLTFVVVANGRETNGLFFLSLAIDFENVPYKPLFKFFNVFFLKFSNWSLISLSLFLPLSLSLCVCIHLALSPITTLFHLPTYLSLALFLCLRLISV